MFIAVNKIAVPATQQQRMVEGFERHAGDLKQLKGFLGLELWMSDDALLAVSRWESKEAMEEYTNHPMFRQHHGNSGDSETKQADVAHYNAKVLI
jgi:heme-degrading monooxygenase HmoA